MFDVDIQEGMPPLKLPFNVTGELLYVFQFSTMLTFQIASLKCDVSFKCKFYTLI